MSPEQSLSDLLPLATGSAALFASHAADSPDRADAILTGLALGAGSWMTQPEWTVGARLFLEQLAADARVARAYLTAAVEPGCRFPLDDCGEIHARTASVAHPAGPAGESILRTVLEAVLPGRADARP